MDLPPRRVTRYAIFTTAHLLSTLKQQHGQRPAFDGKGRLVLLPAVFLPTPPELQLEVQHRRKEIEGILEALKPRKGRPVADAAE